MAGIAALFNSVANENRPTRYPPDFTYRYPQKNPGQDGVIQRGVWLLDVDSLNPLAGLVTQSKKVWNFVRKAAVLIALPAITGTFIFSIIKTLYKVIGRLLERVSGTGGSSLVTAFGASLYDHAGLRYDMPDHVHAEQSSDW